LRLFVFVGRGFLGGGCNVSATATTLPSSWRKIMRTNLEVVAHFPTYNFILLFFKTLLNGYSLKNQTPITNLTYNCNSWRWILRKNSRYMIRFAM
jgi:hypothetical protein